MIKILEIWCTNMCSSCIYTSNWLWGMALESCCCCTSCKMDYEREASVKVWKAEIQKQKQQIAWSLAKNISTFWHSSEALLTDVVTMIMFLCQFYQAVIRKKQPLIRLCTRRPSLWSFKSFKKMQNEGISPYCLITPYCWLCSTNRLWWGYKGINWYICLSNTTFVFLMI